MINIPTANRNQLMTDNKKYCKSLTEWNRRRTREVAAGNVVIGGNNPVVLQSMTNRRPMETTENVEQIIRIARAGGQIVRLTAPSVKDAENLANISSELKNRGYDIPLVADIHFNPAAAMEAAKHVEKVRINPGNFAETDKTKVDYTDEEYSAALQKIKEKFRPLVEYCKTHRVAMRIGSNHGSLSQRIMSRYGDTPEGMVESAVEYLKMAVEMDFHDIVISMKSSNIRVMVQAYRYLAMRLDEEGMDFPFHLGVTEAGNGEDGIIKSAAGNGALLYDGIGDTIRVSLTDEPENEIPVARYIVDYAATFSPHPPVPPVMSSVFNPFEFRKRKSRTAGIFGGKNVPKTAGHDFFVSGDNIIIDGEKYKITGGREFDKNTLNEVLSFAEFGIKSLMVKTDELKNAEKPLVLIFKSDNNFWTSEIRRMFLHLQENGIDLPVIVRKRYDIKDKDRYTVEAAMDFGPLFIDGFGDGMIVENDHLTDRQLADFSLSLLQAARSRFTKADFISCPSCGRTLFDLQEATARIKAATSHLKGVKIGIMGCIVNGPGEMADADYGYVGAGQGKINLYKGKEVVRKNIPEEDAVNQLIELIKENGDWS